MLILGIARRKKSADSYPHTFICTECHSPLKQEEFVKNDCPKCGGKVEGVKELYKKNPDFIRKKI
jgi:transcription initiation factor IIE alpha subunit